MSAETIKTFAWWLTTAGMILLLPRQWQAAAIALGLSLILHGIHRFRSRTTDKQPP